MTLTRSEAIAIRSLACATVLRSFSQSWSFKSDQAKTGLDCTEHSAMARQSRLEREPGSSSYDRCGSETPTRVDSNTADSLALGGIRRCCSTVRPTRYCERLHGAVVDGVFRAITSSHSAVALMYRTHSSFHDAVQPPQAFIAASSGKRWRSDHSAPLRHTTSLPAALRQARLTSAALAKRTTTINGLRSLEGVAGRERCSRISVKALVVRSTCPQTSQCASQSSAPAAPAPVIRKLGQQRGYRLPVQK